MFHQPSEWQNEHLTLLHGSLGEGPFSLFQHSLYLLLFTQAVPTPVNSHALPTPRLGPASSSLWNIFSPCFLLPQIYSFFTWNVSHIFPEGCWLEVVNPRWHHFLPTETLTTFYPEYYLSETFSAYAADHKLPGSLSKEMAQMPNTICATPGINKWFLSSFLANEVKHISRV